MSHAPQEPETENRTTAEDLGCPEVGPEPQALASQCCWPALPCPCPCPCPCAQNSRLAVHLSFVSDVGGCTQAHKKSRGQTLTLVILHWARMPSVTETQGHRPCIPEERPQATARGHGEVRAWPRPLSRVCALEEGLSSRPLRTPAGADGQHLRAPAPGTNPAGATRLVSDSLVMDEGWRVSPTPSEFLFLKTEPVISEHHH